MKERFFAWFQPSPGRLASVDVARGVALIGMFAYHLTWDLAHFGLIDPHAPFSPEFRLFSHGVASSFLFLAGVSLVLSKRTPFDWRMFAHHMARIILAAAAVTIASVVLFPEGLIFFGILHCIAAGLIVAVPFLFLPPLASLLAAVAIVAASMLVQSPVFDAPWLQWTGLGTFEPSSNDFRAFFPWAAPIFAGVAIMSFGIPHGFREWLARWPGAGRLACVLAFGGRHSLAIYLIHQPLFFVALSGLAFAIAPAQTLAERSFAEQCGTQCTASGAPDAVCTRACACSMREMKSLNLWDKLVANALDDGEKLILSRVAQQCVRNSGSP